MKDNLTFTHLASPMTSDLGHMHMQLGHAST